MPNSTLGRTISLYVDGAKYGGLDALLDGKTSAPPSYSPTFMAGDVCTLDVYFRARATDNGVSTAYDLAAGATLVVVGRKSTGDILFSASSFTATGSGSDDSKMTGTLSLATTEIETALTSVEYGSYISIYVDIELRNAGNTERITYRFEAKLYKQVYSGEVSPSDVVLPAALLESPSGYRYQLAVTDDGQLQLTRVL